MIKNYIKIAWRNLIKHKMYTLIKIGGFAFSITACILIAIYILHEKNYDNNYKDVDRIFRIVGVFNDQGVIKRGTSFQAPLSKVIKTDLPEVEYVGRILPNALFYGAGSNQVSTEDNNESVYEDGFTYMDQEVLDMLELPVLFGNRQQALLAPRSLVMTKSKADKLFPGKNPVGKVIYLNGNKESPYTIRAVIEDFPSNSHLNCFNFLLTLKDFVFYPGEQDNWGATNYPIYIKLRQGTDIPQFEKKLTAHIQKNYWIPKLRELNNGKSADTWGTVELTLQPIKDIHLYSTGIMDYKQFEQGDIKFIWLFGAIAVFILLIACINFINLSTAKSANRAKEVGLRKVIGSQRRDLIVQFLCESVLYSLLSFLIGVLLAWITLPLFNLVSGKTLDFPWLNGVFFFTIFLAALFVGILAGIYPAFYLSSFKPVSVFKGEIRQGSKNPTLRNGMVVFQFVTSVILIICTFIVNYQMNFILNKKIGFDKDQIIVLQGTATLGSQLKALKEELGKLPQVKSVSISDYLPVQASGVKRNGNGFWNEGKTQEASQNGQFWGIDENYLTTFGMQLVAGRNFSKDIVSDSSAVIINETLARNLGLKDPIGARITNGTVYTVIGVVQDFNFESLKDNIGGLCLALNNSPTMLAVKLTGKDMETNIQALQQVWDKFAPNQTIRYSFLDESYAKMYVDVKQTGNLFTAFSILAIFIACLGLFGLAAFMTEQRIKEIGIRKVLGASVGSILKLLTKDFLRLVIVANVIAFPVAWWSMHNWLTDFAYRIHIQWWFFLVAAAVSILIALFTVSYQALKTANSKAIDSLRNE
ncbi:ABC transporter permease [Sphingobacterium sp. LRF_L2]|uniref:ABC transporter permease n=1 Tax=Sphingobacterium sp. LRF_L2 TaxID=3369421 RepID=UPI003F6446CA